jgi:hypothetical protein
VKVTVRAGKGEVHVLVATAVLLRDYVFNLEPKKRLVVLVGVAIFAAVPSACTDK